MRAELEIKEAVHRPHLLKKATGVPSQEVFEQNLVKVDSLPIIVLCSRPSISKQQKKVSTFRDASASLFFLRGRGSAKRK